jgi:hypothetical protein
MGDVLRALPSIKAGLESRFSRLVAQRLVHTLIQLHAIATSFATHQLPAAREMATVDTAIGYLQSRRRHLLALLHTIPGVCRGTQRLHGAGRPQPVPLPHRDSRPGDNVDASQPDDGPGVPGLRLRRRRGGDLGSHSFNGPALLFLEPERTAITEMAEVDFSGVRRVSVNRRLTSSKAELENDLAFIAAAYVEFNLHETSYGQLAAFIRSLLPLVVDEYFVRLGSHAHQLHRLHRFGNTENVDHLLQVVCKHVKAHLGTHVLEPAGEEVSAHWHLLRARVAEG